MYPAGYAIHREEKAMKVTIDSIEDKTAILLVGEDDKVKMNMPLVLLPEGCREGDILNISIERDPDATRQARERVSSLMEKLKKKGQGKTGDFCIRQFEFDHSRQSDFDPPLSA